jgi:hypothetical protein
MFDEDATMYFDTWVENGVIYWGGLIPDDNGDEIFIYWNIGYDNEEPSSVLDLYNFIIN